MCISVFLYFRFAFGESIKNVELYLFSCSVVKKCRSFRQHKHKANAFPRYCRYTMRRNAVCS